MDGFELVELHFILKALIYRKMIIWKQIILYIIQIS